MAFVSVSGFCDPDLVVCAEFSEESREIGVTTEQVHWVMAHKYLWQIDDSDLPDDTASPAVGSQVFDLAGVPDYTVEGYLNLVMKKHKAIRKPKDKTTVPDFDPVTHSLVASIYLDRLLARQQESLDLTWYNVYSLLAHSLVQAFKMVEEGSWSDLKLAWLVGLQYPGFYEMQVAYLVQSNFDFYISHAQYDQKLREFLNLIYGIEVYSNRRITLTTYLPGQGHCPSQGENGGMTIGSL